MIDEYNAFAVDGREFVAARKRLTGENACRRVHSISAPYLAAMAHGLQGDVRKHDGQPYIVHPAAVVSLISSIPHSPEMIAAGWLHDTVEDTFVTLDMLNALFGRDVAFLVAMVSKPEMPAGLSRSSRAIRARDHLSHASPEAQTLKLADIIANCADIREVAPDFADLYLSEKRRELEVLAQGSPALKSLARGVLQGSEKSLDEAHALIGRRCGLVSREPCSFFQSC